MVNKSSEYMEGFNRSISGPLKSAEKIGEADIVVGIPFADESDTIGRACETVEKGISEFSPERKCVLVCAGTSGGGGALSAVDSLRLGKDMHRICFLMKDDSVSGTLWRTRAIMQVAYKLGADLALLQPDLQTSKPDADHVGVSPQWIHRLLSPVKRDDIDLVVPYFNRNYLDTPVFNHLINPLLASIFNIMLEDLPAGIFGISSKLLGILLSDSLLTNGHVGNHGSDTWIVTTAAVNEAEICHTSLGAKPHYIKPDGDTFWQESAEVIFNRVAGSEEWWQRQADLVRPVPEFGTRLGSILGEPDSQINVLINRFKRGFNEFQGLYEETLSRKSYLELRKLLGSPPNGFNLTAQLWAEIVYDFLIAYCLEPELPRENLLNAFIPVCYAREASFIQEMVKFAESAQIATEEAEHLISLEAKHRLDRQADAFREKKTSFVESWKEKQEELKPLLPMVTYREFIPGVPLVVPKKIVSPANETIWADGIYNVLLKRKQTEFENFVYERLKLPRDATSSDIAQRIEEMFIEAEQAIDELLLQGDLSTFEGTRDITNAIFKNIPHTKTYSIKPEVTSWILQQHPPPNLLIKHDAANLKELEEIYSPNDILALSSLLEDWMHSLSVWEWIMSNARTGHFAPIDLEPLVVNSAEFHHLTVMKEPSALSKLAGRIIIGNMLNNSGGQFPKLRYLITITKNIVEAELIGQIWERFAHDRKEFGTKVINSLKGHWGKDPLSAHNMFENKVQRIVVERLAQMADAMHRKGNRDLSKLVTSVENIKDCYHLTASFPDGTFIPCSAWTWASYSFKGGKGLPTALSLHVERDWASRDFLLEIYKAFGGSEEEVDNKIAELMGQGKESSSLARVLLPGWSAVEEVMPEQVPKPAEPEAGQLVRFEGNPIIEAIPEHPWESRYVFNPGALRINDKVYILYRGCSEELVSSIGLAVSSDGLHIDERLEGPIFEPKEEWEKKGCEDPRLIIMDKRIYMLYTAYSSIAAQIALASISVDDFLKRRWGKWKRHGLAFPGFEDKDATVFPQSFNGWYVMYHRIDPSMWISVSERLDCPWPREDHRILLGPGAGMVWDGFKVGGGSQPIKTKYGWLLIYHGVDHSFIYRLGVLLVALHDPGWILYRSPNPILEPQASCELGEEGCYVPNVVFCCGAVPAVDKAVLEDDDEVLVYYGAADTAICVAMAKVSDLIPEDIRRDRDIFSHT